MDLAQALPSSTNRPSQAHFSRESTIQYSERTQPSSAVQAKDRHVPVVNHDLLNGEQRTQAHTRILREHLLHDASLSAQGLDHAEKQAQAVTGTARGTPTQNVLPHQGHFERVIWAS